MGEAGVIAVLGGHDDGDLPSSSTRRLCLRSCFSDSLRMIPWCPMPSFPPCAMRPQSKGSHIASKSIPIRAMGSRFRRRMSMRERRPRPAGATCSSSSLEGYWRRPGLSTRRRPDVRRRAVSLSAFYDKEEKCRSLKHARCIWLHADVNAIRCVFRTSRRNRVRTRSTPALGFPGPALAFC